LEAPHLNNCALAAQLDVSDELVRRVRKSLEFRGLIAPLETIARRDGTVYTTGAGNLAVVDGSAEPGAG
jgi:hypothetical protein